MHHEDQLTQT
jgi:amidase